MTYVQPLYDLYHKKASEIIYLSRLLLGLWGEDGIYGLAGLAIFE